MERRKEAGQVLVQTALALTVLMGFAGLAIDMGVLRYEKRLQQSAADAAAIAGASNIPFEAGAGIIPGARDAAAKNGFSCEYQPPAAPGQTDLPAKECHSDITACDSADSGTICVEVNHPPKSGPHQSQNQYVEVLVRAVHPTYFMRVLGHNREVVTARAVATSYSGGPNEGCIYTLNPNTVGIEGVNINGNATLNAPNCGILDNGNFDTKGNAFQVTAATFGVSGNWPKQQGTVTCTADPTNCPALGMPAVSDPLSYLKPPTRPTTDYGSYSTKANGTETLNPGRYSSITFGKNSTVTLNPGIYYIDGTGGITFNGGATVKGDGVMFYFGCPTAGPCSGGPTINATGGGNNAPNIQLTPMTSGDYAGILFYQDPRNTTGPSLGGDDGSKFDGVLYFPEAKLTFFGNSTNYTAGMIVSGAIALSGHPTVNVEGPGGLPTGVGIVKNAVLVE